MSEHQEANPTLKKPAAVRKREWLPLFILPQTIPDDLQGDSSAKEKSKQQIQLLLEENESLTKMRRSNPFLAYATEDNNINLVLNKNLFYCIGAISEILFQV